MSWLEWSGRKFDKGLGVDVFGVDVGEEVDNEWRDGGDGGSYGEDEDEDGMALGILRE